MNINSLLNERHSCRAFLDKPVPAETLEQIFALAQRAPSNCNVQPWQTLVVSGEQKDALSQALVHAVMQQQPPNPDFNWAIAYQNEHRERQFGSANALYSAMGIAREDKRARQMAMLRNWQFFDAPHVAIFTMDKYLDIMGAVDMGIYAQSLSLIMQQHGISNCMQGALGQFPDPIREMFGLPEERGVLFGMSFGYADPDAPANQVRTTREDLKTNVQFF
ncbi:nitroreductase [Alteromonas sp. LMIT006]|uniref:nitroreductase n=1 Tax=Alteromonadaceae TaxID=72275 RepID=UPI0020CA7386|nr:nitroreductase [Alteromonas sp. LMIT006]UTP73240.1 nitroreductase [Alteromonas sp. LMIT006]